MQPALSLLSSFLTHKKGKEEWDRHQGAVQDSAFASLPSELLAQIHRRVLQAAPSLHSCLALEATCKYLRSTLHSNARFEEVRVKAGHLPATTPKGASCWRWIAAHGRRTDLLLLDNLVLHRSTPRLCDQAGVLLARAVAVSATLVDTLEPLRGLLNLESVTYSGPERADGAVSVEPLAGLPALEHVDLDSFAGALESLAPLGRLTSLTRLYLLNHVVPSLDELGSLSKLRELELVGFAHVTSVAPLVCLTALTSLVLFGLESISTLAPLEWLSRLQTLELFISSTPAVSLQPLCRLTALSRLCLQGGGPDTTSVYDLQPLSELSGTLQELHLKGCVLQNLPAIGLLGTTLGRLSLKDCKPEQHGFRLVPLFSSLSGLTFLSISRITSYDLHYIGRNLKRLQALKVKHAGKIQSLACLSTLTRMTSIGLKSCTHISSIAPLTALTGLQHLHLRSCPQLTSLSALTALQSLRKLRLECCLQLAASLPTSLQLLLVVPGQNDT
jgi:hypothetical protein